MSEPFNGNVELNGGYAQFGQDLDDGTSVQVARCSRCIFLSL